MTTSQPSKTATAPAKPGRPPRNTSPVTKPVEELSEPSTKILIHFVEDGLTAFGSVWLAGQELELENPSVNYDSTCDRNGDSWLQLTEEDQVKHWGTVKFKNGPAPEELDNPIIHYKLMRSDGVDLSGRPKYQGYMSHQERAAAAKVEAARGRQVPKN